MLNTFINQVIAQYEQQCITSENKKGSVIRISKRILRANDPFSKFLTLFIKAAEAINKHRKLYYVSAANRMFSLNFLKAIISEPDLYNKAELYYQEEESKAVLNKFFRNKLYCALHTSIPKNTIFSLDDLKRTKEYERFYKKNVKEYKNHFNVSSMYFKKPFQLESSVFYEKCGIPQLSEQILNKLVQSEKQAILDCGAYTGDSAVVFSQLFENIEIWAIEFSKSNYNLLIENIEKNNLSERIKPINVGVGSSSEIIKVNANPGLNVRQGVEGELFDLVQMVTIDELCQDQSVALIKMDIEGGEMEALKGAISTIKRDKPVLLLSVYHLGSDIYSIPQFIKQLNLNYSFKLRHLKPDSPTIDYILICEVRD